MQEKEELEMVVNSLEKALDEERQRCAALEEQIVNMADSESLFVIGLCVSVERERVRWH
jgi:hypothetical protein